MTPWVITTIAAAIGLVIGSRPGRAASGKGGGRLVPVPVKRPRRRDVGT